MKSLTMGSSGSRYEVKNNPDDVRSVSKKERKQEKASRQDEENKGKVSSVLFTIYVFRYAKPVKANGCVM